MNNSSNLQAYRLPVCVSWRHNFAGATGWVSVNDFIGAWLTYPARNKQSPHKNLNKKAQRCETLGLGETDWVTVPGGQ
jgi:hypothetical protein